MGEDNTQHLPSEDIKRILARFDSVDSGLATLDTRLTTFDTRLTTLEEKVDRRLQETRPIWEQVLTRLDSLDIRMGSLESEMRSGFRKLERQMGELAKDVIIVRADQRDLEKRMDKLESEPTR